MSGPWTTPADVRTRVRRRWDDGSLLRAYALAEPFGVLDLPVHGPPPAEIGERLAEVQRWIVELNRGARGGSRYDVVDAPIGGRHFGRNLIPGRIRLSRYEQAWQLLGVGAEVDRFERILELVAPIEAARAGVVAEPLQALEIGDAWPAVLAAYAWLDAARGSGRYLREITAPGVDTKFVEGHRGVLARLLGVGRSGPDFLAGLGLRAKPETVRLRFDPVVLSLPHTLGEATLRVVELAATPATVERVVIVENEITYLSVPVPARGIVLWGKGFEVDRAGALPWLAAADVAYWGDLDSHGFAILDRLRAWLPQTRSFLMDRATLLVHRERWVREPSPTSARLTRLTDAESDLYADLVTDRFAEAVRLEQERIDWAWALDRLPFGSG